MLALLVFHLLLLNIFGHQINDVITSASVKNTKRRQRSIDDAITDDSGKAGSNLTILNFPYDENEEATFANLSGRIDVASLNSLTVCSAFMIEVLTDANDAEYDYMQIFQILDPSGNEVASVYLEVGSAFISLEFQDIFLSKLKPGLLRPLTWMRSCYTLDFETASVVLMLNGKLVGKEQGHKKIKTDQQGSLSFSIENYLAGKLTQLNIFSPALSEHEMKSMTSALSDNCGSSGNLLSWENAAWNLFGKAVRQNLVNSDGPCWKKGSLFIFNELKTLENCMDHCKNIGGRSPAVRTLEEWQELKKEMDRFFPQDAAIWLALTRKDDEWKDFYTGEQPYNFTKQFTGHYFAPEQCAVVAKYNTYSPIGKWSEKCKKKFY